MHTRISTCKWWQQLQDSLIPVKVKLYTYYIGETIYRYTGGNCIGSVAVGYKGADTQFYRCIGVYGNCKGAGSGITGCIACSVCNSCQSCRIVSVGGAISRSIR